MPIDAVKGLGPLFFTEQDRLLGGPGDFMGLPATGRTIAVPAIAILRVADGKVTELRAVFDQMGMLQQLGAAPA